MNNNITRNIADLEKHKFLHDATVQVAPGYSARDAFGRGRVSQPFGIFDSKQVGDDDPNAWEFLTVGAGSSIVYNQQRSSSILTVDTAVDDRAVRQTRLYMPYVPGRSHLLELTAALGIAVEGIEKRVGYFDALDGVYFEQYEQSGETKIRIVIRSSVSGSVVETKIEQEAWNLDKLDGYGSSKIKLASEHNQIFIIDLQWLGVGTVRFGFNIDGATYYVHEANHSNIAPAGVYMKTPSLPIRYEIHNVAGGNTASLEQICCTAISEGGYENAGFEFAESNGTTFRAISARTPILAVRMASAFNGDVNRRLGQLLESFVYSDDNNVYWELMHIHDPSAVTGTFNTISPASGVEVSTDISSITATIQHKIRPGFAIGGAGPRGGSPAASTAFKTRHTQFNRNMANDNSQYFVMFATPITTANVSAGLVWVEFS